jgi:hypothetical protein
MTTDRKYSLAFNTPSKDPLLNKKFLLASGTALVAATAVMPLVGLAAPIGLAIIGETAIGAGLAKTVVDKWQKIKQNRKAATPG